MTVLEVLETASLYLNIRGELDSFFNSRSIIPPSEEEETKFNNLLKALNLVVREISSEFKPLYYVESVTFENNRAKISSLTQQLLKIVEIKDANQSYKHTIVGDEILIDSNGPKAVKYTIVPEQLVMYDDVNFFESIYEKPLALGVCMEYYYMNNIFDEANVWEERFYRSLQNCLRTTGRYIMPESRWD